MLTVVALGPLTMLGSGCGTYEVALKDRNPEGMFDKPAPKTGRVHLYPCEALTPLVDLGEGMTNLDPSYERHKTSEVHTKADVLDTLTRRTADTLTSMGHTVTVGTEPSGPVDLAISCHSTAVTAGLRFNSVLPGVVATAVTMSPIFTGGTTPRALVSTLYKFQFGEDPLGYVVAAVGKGSSYLHLTAGSGLNRAMEEALEESQMQLAKATMLAIAMPKEFREEYQKSMPRLILREGDNVADVLQRKTAPVAKD